MTIYPAKFKASVETKREIWRLADRGHDVAQIAVWLNRRMSFINQVLALRPKLRPKK